MGRYGRSLVSSQVSFSCCPFHAACCNRCITRVVASCRIVHARHIACCLVSCAGPFLGDLTAQDRNIWAAQRAEFEALSPQAHRKRHAARISCNRTGASWRAAERADAGVDRCGAVRARARLRTDAQRQHRAFQAGTAARRSAMQRTDAQTQALLCLLRRWWCMLPDTLWCVVLLRAPDSLPHVVVRDIETARLLHRCRIRNCCRRCTATTRTAGTTSCSSTWTQVRAARIDRSAAAQGCEATK